MEHTHLHRLVDLAEGRIHAGLDGGLGGLAGLLAVGGAGGETALHQGAQSRLVGAVEDAVALGNLNALLRRLVIGHRLLEAGSAIKNPTFKPSCDLRPSLKSLRR